MMMQSPPPASDTHCRILISVTLALWALVATGYVVGMYSDFSAFGSQDTDVILRQVQVRDFLAGQGWFDLLQRRMNAPAGLVMHWSRLIDAPIAGLILVFDPLVGRAGAEALAMTIWPLLLMGTYLGASAVLGYRLGGLAGGIMAVMFAALTSAAIAHFRVGGIDHHNIQIAAFVLMVWLTVQVPMRPAAALWLGVVSAVMLAIGLETLPFIVAAATILSIGFVLAPQSFAPSAIRFGLALAGTTAVLYAALVPTPFAAPNVCDALSPLFLAYAVAGGGGLALVAWLPLRGVWMRLAALAGLGAALLIITANTAPECFGGPLFMLDARLRKVWFDEVSETKSLLRLLPLFPGTEVVAKFGVPLMALIGGCLIAVCSRGGERRLWGIVLLNLAVATALAALQVRYAAFSGALAAPVAAAVAARYARAALASGNALRLGLAALVVAAGCPVTWIILGADLVDPVWGGQRAVEKTAQDAAAMECLSPQAHEPLNRLEPGIVLNSFNLGTSILLHTRHSVVAGHYHRNVDGMNAVIDAFGGDETTARAIASQRQARYVAICAGDSETASWTMNAPAGLMARLIRGDTVDWLQPLDRTGKIHIWEIKR